MKKIVCFLVLANLIALVAFPQATPGTYPYPKPLPATGGISTPSVHVTGVINPTSYQDHYPAVWDVFIGGGLRSVGTTAERDAIRSTRRKQGMWVYVCENQHMYSLATNLTTWLDIGLVTTNIFSGGNTPTIYTSSGNIASNRVVGGLGTNSLTFSSLSALNVSADLVSLTGNIAWLIGVNDVFVDSPNAVELSAPVIRIVSSNVLHTNAVIGQVWTLGNAMSGAGEWADGGGLTVYSGDGTIIDLLRTVSGVGTNTLSLTNFAGIKFYSYDSSITVANEQAITAGGTIINSAGNSIDNYAGVNLQSSAGAATLRLHAADGIMLGFEGGPGDMYINTSSVLSNTVAPGMVLTVIATNATGALVEFSTASGFSTIYNNDGSLLTNRTVTGAGHTLSFQGNDEFNVAATNVNVITSGNALIQGGSVNLNGATVVQINSGGPKPFEFTLTPDDGAWTDLILGRESVTTGEVRDTSGLTFNYLRTFKSFNAGDASYTIAPGEDRRIYIVRAATPLTANRTVVLPTDLPVDSILEFVRQDTGAFTLDIGGVKTLPSGTPSSCRVIWDGATWTTVSYGLL